MQKVRIKLTEFSLNLRLKQNPLLKGGLPFTSLRGKLSNDMYLTFEEKPLRDGAFQATLHTEGERREEILLINYSDQEHTESNDKCFSLDVTDKNFGFYFLSPFDFENIEELDS